MSVASNVDWNRLLTAARTGDQRSSEELFRQLEVRLRRVAGYRLWGLPGQDLDDLVQNTLLVFSEKWQTIETNPHLFAVQILHNKVYHLLRDQKGKRQVAIITDSADDVTETVNAGVQVQDESVDIEETVGAADLQERIRYALVKLAPFCQRLFLGILEERTIGEIWESIQQSEASLKRATFDKRIFDCRKRLRVLISEEQES